MLDYARNAHKRGIKVIIAGAGGAAHLPGMVAALTPLPTVGVPVTPVGAHLDGLDALLSIVQVGCAPSLSCTQQCISICVASGVMCCFGCHVLLQVSCVASGVMVLKCNVSMTSLYSTL